MSAFERIFLRLEPHYLVILQGVQILAFIALLLLLFNIWVQRRILNELRREISLFQVVSSFFSTKGIVSLRKLSIHDLAQIISDNVVQTTGIPFALILRIFPEAGTVRLLAFSPGPLINSILSDFPEQTPLLSESLPFLPQSVAFKIAGEGHSVFNKDVLEIFPENSPFRKFLHLLMEKTLARGLYFSLLYVDKAPFTAFIFGSLRSEFSHNFLFLLEKIRHFSQILLEIVFYGEQKEDFVSAVKLKENLLNLLNDISRTTNLQMDITSIIQYSLARIEEEIPSFSAMVLTISPEKTDYKLTGITRTLSRKGLSGTLKVGTTFPVRHFPRIGEWKGPFLIYPPADVPPELSHLTPLYLFPIQTTDQFYGILVVSNSSSQLSESTKEFCAGLAEHL
ncbi:MAG: hypothetical protein ACK4G3_04185, partial [bacterium]